MKDEWVESILWCILVFVLAVLIIWFSYEIGIRVLPLLMGKPL
jgi:hypothetical protein